IAPPRETRASNFWGRPFKVIHADEFARDQLAQIQDPAIRAVATRYGKSRIGSVDQISDCTDVVSYPAVYGKLRALYE
ncbi:MAG TPA: hypothetical protein VFZ25_05225, partial [Chloroflexota bacterium]|nr:hypothetical protein [Chloroflexota bacterium]